MQPGGQLAGITGCGGFQLLKTIPVSPQPHPEPTACNGHDSTPTHPSLIYTTGGCHAFIQLTILAGSLAVYGVGHPEATLSLANSFPS
jgi:hypothetical protein